MEFVSLADPSDRVSFEEAIFKGVPNDTNSLYVPETIPRLPQDEVETLYGANQVHIGKTMLRPFVAGEIEENDLDRLVREAVIDMPLREVGDRKVLELFHGDTEAFKDVPAKQLARIIGFFAVKYGHDIIIVTATSGDTGGAVAENFAGVSGVKAVVAFPKDRVAKLQFEQLTRVADNVLSIEVDGSFDNCTNLVECAFADKDLKEGKHLTSANSVNVGRWAPQTKFVATVLSQSEGELPAISTPTGNVGHLTSDIMAAFMLGISGARFRAACNINDPTVRYLSKGLYEPRASERTLANAMDVGRPKNFARLKWLFGGDIDKMRQMISGTTVTDREIVQTTIEVYEQTGYVLDPHTAVAWRASQPGDVVEATASPAKFAEEIYDYSGIAVDNSVQMARLKSRPRRYLQIDNSPEQFKELISSF